MANTAPSFCFKTNPDRHTWGDVWAPETEDESMVQRVKSVAVGTTGYKDQLLFVLGLCHHVASWLDSCAILLSTGEVRLGNIFLDLLFGYVGSSRITVYK